MTVFYRQTAFLSLNGQQRFLRNGQSQFDFPRNAFDKLAQLSELQYCKAQSPKAHGYSTCSVNVHAQSFGKLGHSFLHARALDCVKIAQVWGA